MRWRSLFAWSVCAAIAVSTPAGAASVRAYIGTDTADPTRPVAESAESHGEGIYLVEMNTTNGRLSPPRLVAKTTDPIWITIDQSRRILYAVNAIGFNGTRTGSVSAFTIDRESGGLALINTVSSQGMRPAYISIHPSGKFALVANYGGGPADGGSLVVLPILPNGGLGEALDVAHAAGPLHPARAADDPPGNFAISDHRVSRFHMVATDPSGRLIVVDDAGLDQISLWRLDLMTGKLIPNAPPSFVAPPGSAPRHFVFGAGGHRLYQLYEQDSVLGFYDFDPQTGVIGFRQKVSTLPPEFAGSNLGAELLISRNGHNLYASNRLHDTVAAFAIDARGYAKPIGEVPTHGDYPRSMAIDPTGRYLYALNERGDSITTFRIDRKAGALHFADQYLPLGSPVVMTFLN